MALPPYHCAFHWAFPSKSFASLCTHHRVLSCVLAYGNVKLALLVSVGELNDACNVISTFLRGGTHGTISSFKPLMNRIGTSIIEGRTSLLGHIWWHNRAMYLAGGKTLKEVSDC